MEIPLSSCIWRLLHPIIDRAFLCLCIPNGSNLIMCGCRRQTKMGVHFYSCYVIYLNSLDVDKTIHVNHLISIFCFCANDWCGRATIVIFRSRSILFKKEFKIWVGLLVFSLICPLPPPPALNLSYVVLGALWRMLHIQLTVLYQWICPWKAGTLATLRCS